MKSFLLNNSLVVTELVLASVVVTPVRVSAGVQVRITVSPSVSADGNNAL